MKTSCRGMQIQSPHCSFGLSTHVSAALMPHLQVDWTLVTDLLIDLFFMSDILLNFNTGFISDQVRQQHVCCFQALSQS